MHCTAGNDLIHMKLCPGNYEGCSNCILEFHNNFNNGIHFRDGCLKTYGISTVYDLND